jgi:hypothetical protein
MSPSVWYADEHRVYHLAKDVEGGVSRRRPFPEAAEARKRVLEEGWPW